VNELAVVSQVFCLRLSIVTESACCPKPPEGPATPGTSFSVPASWPMTMLLNVASPDRLSESTIRLLAVAGVFPPPAVIRSVSGPR
jgi:hypothetical protein